MTIAPPPPDVASSGFHHCLLDPYIRAGQALARTFVSVKPRGPRAPRRQRELAGRILAQARDSSEKTRAWLLENARLLHTAEREALELSGGLHRFPVVFDAQSPLGPRVALAARTYLECAQGRFSEDSCPAFLEGFQSVMPLEMGEIWALKPALQLEILTQLVGAPPTLWPSLVASLRRIGETDWKELFESVSLVHRALAADPAGAYARMDFESRELYRNVIGSLGKHSRDPEPAIASAAVALAREAGSGRRGHAGYYLLDRGLSALQQRIGYRPPFMERLTRPVIAHPTAFFLSSIAALTCLIVAVILSYSGHRSLAPLLLLILPATQAAIDFVNHLVTWLARPRVLPKLDFTAGIPGDCATMVAVPTLLLKQDQVRDLILDLEIRFLANRDPNLYFALLTDSPDADAPEDERDSLVTFCREKIEELNRRYPGSPFFLFHRHRIYNDSEGRYMGWERKRGKLLDLNRLMRGGFDAFPVKTGDLTALPRIRYVITLDSDTQLPRDSAARLVGALAHPLNAAVVDPVRKIVVEGYGILQPRIGISIQSSSRSRLAALYSGETGFDIYTRAVSDVYQDLFGEGIFTGKGIYEVDAMRQVLEHRFPENALLSHDLIEGAYARVGLVTDIELIDDYPSHFSAYNRRKHRWVRGDWQILRWILGRVPDFERRLVSNPISVISRWKIMDNLRRSLIEPGLLVLLLGSWFFLPGSPAYWTVAALAMLFAPVYCDLLFALLRMPLRGREFKAWSVATARSLAQGHLVALFGLIFLLHQALVSLDAIVRSILRVFVTRRRLLEWETAAEAEAAVHSKATVDVYLEWTPFLGLALIALLWIVRPAALSSAAPILVLWTASRAFSAFLNQPPHVTEKGLTPADTAWLRDQARAMYGFFEDWCTPGAAWLIPDNVHEDGEAALRVSPTNIGMLLNARVAALHLGVLPLPDFIAQTRRSLATVQALEKCRGHLFNWYDLPSLQPLEPRFVSTVDSGNLAAALWTLKQAALARAAEAPSAGLHEIAALCDDLVRDMDFAFLYNPRKKIVSLGYDSSRDRLEPACYDLLASEARTAVFVAIAKGDIPQDAWFHLGRAHTLAAGERVLLSWTGTMFEYLMPVLWMRHYPGTILEQSIHAAVRIQREYAAALGVPWGISESACLSEGSEYAYAPFGIPSLALKPASGEPVVISPYSSLLALAVDPAAAVSNLRRMQQSGWTGRYGFYESVDYSRSKAEVIRSWMAHHQGMALLAICNLLCDDAVQRCFHAEPQVLATELLLHERVPAAIETDTEALAAEA